MRGFLKKALALILALAFILPSVLVCYATDEEAYYQNDSSSNIIDNAVLNDYGFNISAESLAGYSETNGDVSNSPFGKVYMDSFTYQEPLYIAANNKNYIEASADSKLDVAANGFDYEEISILSNGFINVDTNEKINTASIDYSVTATGDFSRDTRNDGIAVIFAVGSTSTESAGQDIKIYLSVFDPNNSTDTPNCKLICTLSHGIIHKIEDISSLIDIKCGNYLPGNENSMGISPDEIIVKYPKVNGNDISTEVAVYNLRDTSDFAWKNQISWMNLQQFSVKDDSCMSTLAVGDINEDGYDDIVVVVSAGVSRMKYDIKLGKSSSADISVYYGGAASERASAKISGLYRAAAAVCNINNDGKPNVVVCGITDMDLSSSGAVLKEKAVTLSSDLKEEFSCTASSNISNDKLGILNNTLRQNPVVIKTTQSADNRANKITGSSADSIYSVMYDGMFIVAKNTKNEMSFVGGSRVDYLKSDSTLTGAYAGMVYTNSTSVCRDEIFMVYVKNQAMSIDVHSKTAEVSRGTVLNSAMNIFALPNTDHDSGVLRYDGWCLTHTDPVAKAILAAAPTFGDFLHIEENYIVMGSTTFASSSTSGEDIQQTWNSEIQLGFNIAIVSAGVTAAFQGSFTRQTEKTVSTPFTATKETLVVVMTIPVEIYSYTLFTTKPDGGLEAYSYEVPVVYGEQFTTMTVPEYDRVAAKYGKDTVGNTVVIHTDGDPSSYAYTDEKIKELTNDSEAEPLVSKVWMRTNYNKGLNGSSIEISEGHSTSYSFTVSAEVTAAGSGGSVGYGNALITSGAVGNSYQGNVRNLPELAADDGYGFEWKLKAFYVKVNGNKIPFITYEVKNCSSNPRCPDNVVARGYDAYDENGNRIPANIISWNEYASDADKDISYAILRKHTFTGAFQTVGTVPYGVTSFVDKDERLEFGTEYEYVVRAVKNVANAPNRQSITSPVEVARTLSEHGAIDVSLTVKNAEVMLGKTVTVGVDVGDTSGRKLEYQWMRRLAGDIKWTDITDEISAEYDIVGTSYVMDGAEYRCIVMETIILPDGSKTLIYTYSDVVTLAVK